MSVRYAVATRGIINNNPLLGVALGADICYQDKTAQAVLAWGQKPSRAKAMAFAQLHGLPLITVEDGFLRSLVGGVDSVGGSFIIDELGVYFDLTAPNRLQQLIADTVATWCDEMAQTAQVFIQKIITHQLSKYNATTYAPNLSALANNDKPHIILIDQVVGDASIVGAGADGERFLAMLTHAKQTYPNANIWIKAHPAGKGHFCHDDVDVPFYLTNQCNSMALLTQATAVYTVSSHMGFEALLLGKKVHNFGVNWYAGFGLTEDDFVKNEDIYRQVTQHHHALNILNPTVHQLFYASYVRYSHYANPATGQACDWLEMVDYLVMNRAWQDKLAGKVLVYDFSRWKIPFLRGFLGFDGVNLTVKPKTKWWFFLPQPLNAKRANRHSDKVLTNLEDGSYVAYVVWGQKSKQELMDKLSHVGITTPTVWCMEDGFIRSNGLGATLIAPLSVVMDDVGIYFDATAPSRLEIILNTLSLTNEQRERVNRLHAQLLTKRVSKYNVLTKNHDFHRQVNSLASQNRSIHLVVGQVEDDASVRLCTSVIKKNSELLADVRKRYPNDIIIYKPHPDVEAGLRVGKANNHQLADVVAHDVAMPDCLDVCDVVHTISSLTGFEALLRGKKVVCYGLPFYAGFGLTEDVIEIDNIPKKEALARRQRVDLPPLDLPTLIFGTLIAYPVYRLPHGVGLASVEQVIDYLYNHQHTNPSRTSLAQVFKTALMRLRNLTKA